MSGEDDDTTATRKKHADGTNVGTPVTATVATWNAMLALLPASIGNPSVAALVSGLATLNAT